MRKVILVLFLGVILGCSPDEEEVVIATAEIVSYDLGNGVATIGSFRATYTQGATTVEILLKDQFRGTIHSAHLYEGTCEEPGEIWNLGTTDNYCQVSSINQTWFKPNAGDIGNLLIEEDGTGKLTVTTDLWKIGGGSTDDILGKLIIVHAGPEDFLTECDPNHIPDHFHPNSKMGCGEIIKL